MPKREKDKSATHSAAVNAARDAIDKAVEKLSPDDHRAVLEDLASMIELRIAGLDEEAGADDE